MNGSQYPATQRKLIVLKTPPGAPNAAPTLRERAHFVSEDREDGGGGVVGKVKQFLRDAEEDAPLSTDNAFCVFEDTNAEGEMPEDESDSATTDSSASLTATTPPQTRSLYVPPAVETLAGKRKRVGFSESGSDSGSEESSTEHTTESDNPEAASAADEALHSGVRAAAAGVGCIPHLNAAIKAYHTAAGLSTAQEKIRNDFFADLCRKVTGIIPRGKLVLFGSSATGLCTAQSDLDVTLITDPDQDAKNVLQTLKNPIGRMSRVQFIRNARVPILKCVGRHPKFQFDISCNRPEGGWNAKIIRNFLSLDARVAPALFYLHEVFDKSGIKNARFQLLSAFSMNVSFIHYLQSVEKPSVLPHITWTLPHVDGDHRETDVEIHSNSARYLNPGENKKSAGQLFVDYVYWYDFSSLVFSCKADPFLHPLLDSMKQKHGCCPVAIFLCRLLLFYKPTLAKCNHHYPLPPAGSTQRFSRHLGQDSHVGLTSAPHLSQRHLQCAYVATLLPRSSPPPLNSLPSSLLFSFLNPH